MRYEEPTRLRLELPGGRGHMSTDPADVASLPGEVLDAHPVLVSYGGDAVQIAYDARAEIPGLEAAVARVSDIDPEGMRAWLLTEGEAPELDEIEAAAVGRLDVVMFDALDGDPKARRAVLAGYVLVGLRRALRGHLAEPPGE